MTELARLAAELGDFCQCRGWRFCVIGGLAVQVDRWSVDSGIPFNRAVGDNRPYQAVN